MFGIRVGSVSLSHPPRRFNKWNIEEDGHVPSRGEFVAVQEDSIHDEDGSRRG
ncbi:hypothetical protein MMUC44124_29560 [Mycolicibacterium mucogenicum DSM 44124]|nr:hypothetical protein MMUC44124_29560 [Mycolicibacterium mucogenicum DSM 44124]